MKSSQESFADSLWWNESEEPPCGFAPHTGQSEVDVAIVGGGITGVSAALHLAEAGLRVALFEARHIGFGASGRNGGQVIPGLKYDPEDLVAKYGPDRGGRLAEMAGGAADLTFDLIARHGIRCNPVRGGWIQAAHSPHALEAVTTRARQWQARGVPVEILSRDEVAARTGTANQFGGWRDPRAGAIQPLDYTRGLARAAARAGAMLYEQSPVRELVRTASGWSLRAGQGRCTAKRVILGTNAYTDRLKPGLAQSVLPVQSMQLATDPLPADLAARIMPGGLMMSETRKLAFYMRQTPRGGLMIGGRGAVGDGEDARLMAALERGMLKLFPDLAGVPVRYRWSGHVCLSLDGLPHFHEPEPGLICLLAYNGRGVALASAFGRMLAEEIAGRGEAVYPRTRLARIGWHALRRPVMGLGVRWYWLKDSLGFASK